MKNRPSEIFVAPNELVIPSEFRREPHKSAGDLCVEITMWTRDKIDDEGVLELQEKTNALFDKVLKANMENVESDEDNSIYVQKQEILEKLKELKVARGNEFGNRCISAIQQMMKEQEFSILMNMRGFERLLFNKPQLRSAHRAEEVMDFFFTTSAINPEEKVFKRDLVNSLKQFHEIVNIVQQESEKEPAEDDTDYVLAQHQNLLPSLQTQLEFAKWIAHIRAGIQQHQTEEELQTRIQPLMRMPNFKKLIETRAYSADPSISQQELHEVEQHLRKWLKENHSEARFSYNFVSKEERDSMRALQKGSDYNDYLMLRMNHQENSFSIFLSEKLGVRTYIDNNTSAPKFKIREIIESLKKSISNVHINNPLAKNDKMEEIWRDYGHVDMEYRQLQIKILDASIEAVETVLQEIFRCIEKTREKKA